ncbi:hypothetical protein [Bradyrhizobium diazoefficiens]|uniref:hypothetical protein n=1 Tax=Bradyrhizobium diazoefficiens TaxID=1355477 RepID=UPI00272BC6D7|nr:hypothetical protein [Bradyrhizobium diazoefficiens]WLA63772.1 hypothetical protein QNN01_36240 [Bradyrhizobium diazoefficiens]
MLIIDIELVPGGVHPLRKSIGSLRISNLSNLANVSDYAVVAMEAANPLTSAPSRIAKCTVVNHPRRQSVFALLRAAAEALEAADWVEL